MKFWAVNVQISSVYLEIQSKVLIYTLMKNDKKTPKLDEFFFHRKISGISKELATKMYFSLFENENIDKKTQYLKGNPRKLNPLKKFQPGKAFELPNMEGLNQILLDIEKEDMQRIPIIEELNVLQNVHEITADQFDRVLTYFVAVLE
eukprot:Pgem_evm1s3197